jgi:hypothetical protein
MVNGLPDRTQFFTGIRSLITQAAKAARTEHPRITIFGECVGLLCADGNPNAAIQLEKTGNDLMQAHKIDILCGYPLSSFQHGPNDPTFKSICAEHTFVYSR